MSIGDRLGPDVRTRMESIIARQASRPTGSPAVDALLAGPRAELVESREQYKQRMLGPTSRPQADAAALADAMAKLAPLFGVKRKPWAELSSYDQALWTATVREALT